MFDIALNLCKLLPKAADDGTLVGLGMSSFTPENIVNFGTNGTFSDFGQFSSVGASDIALINLRLHRTVTCSNWAMSTAVATSNILLLITSSLPKIETKRLINNTVQ